MKSTPGIALALFQLSSEMTGPAAYSKHRDAYRKRVLKVWPEAEAGIPGDDPMQKEEREVEISPEEQTALGEGLWSMYSKDTSSDRLRELCETLAKAIGVSKAFNSRLEKVAPIKDLMAADDAITGDEDAGKPE